VDELKKKVGINGFFQKNLAKLRVDWNFLKEQTRPKFKLMITEISIMVRVRHFEEMFMMVMAFLGFSMSTN
jgi:hypothetical protein